MNDTIKVLICVVPFTALFALMSVLALGSDGPWGLICFLLLMGWVNFMYWPDYGLMDRLDAWWPRA